MPPPAPPIGAAANGAPSHLRECRDCGQFQIVPSLPPAARALCLRCDGVLRHTQHDPLRTPLALNLTALLPAADRGPIHADAGQHRRPGPRRRHVHRPGRPRRARHVGACRRRAVHHRRRACRQARLHAVCAHRLAGRAPAPPSARGFRLGRAPAPVVHDRGLSARRLRCLREAPGAGLHRAWPRPLRAGRPPARHDRRRHQAGFPVHLGGDGPPRHHAHNPGRAGSPRHRLRHLRPGVRRR